MDPSFEVVKLGIGPSMCCAICKYVMRPGEKVRTKLWPILFRYGKQRKKAKANTHYALMVHSECFNKVEPVDPDFLEALRQQRDSKDQRG